MLGLISYWTTCGVKDEVKLGQAVKFGVLTDQLRTTAAAVAISLSYPHPPQTNRNKCIHVDYSGLHHLFYSAWYSIPFRELYSE